MNLIFFRAEKFATHDSLLYKLKFKTRNVARFYGANNTNNLIQKKLDIIITATRIDTSRFSVRMLLISKIIYLTEFLPNVYCLTPRTIHSQQNHCDGVLSNDWNTLLGEQISQHTAMSMSRSALGYLPKNQLSKSPNKRIEASKCLATSFNQNSCFSNFTVTSRSRADLEVQLVQLNHCDGVYSNY